MIPQPPSGAPKKSLLSGLAPDRNVTAFAKGQQMQASAAMGMDRAQKQQEMGVSQMQEDAQQRQRTAQNYTSRFGNEAQERNAAANLDNRRNVFDLGMNFSYAALQRNKNLNLQQALFNSAARNF
jgi:hypothetical protein